MLVSQGSAGFRLSLTGRWALRAAGQTGEAGLLLRGAHTGPGAAAASLAQSRSRPEPGLPGALLGAETRKHGPGTCSDHSLARAWQPGQFRAESSLSVLPVDTWTSSAGVALEMQIPGFSPNLWVQSCLQVTRTRPGRGACQAPGPARELRLEAERLE